MAKNRKCLACSTKYSYCPSCSRADALAPSWKAEFCSESCKDLWLTATRYNMNRITKSEAKSIISELDLKPIESYVECVQRDLKNIMAEEKKLRRSHKKVEPIVEEVQVEQEIVESHEVVIKKENE